MSKYIRDLPTEERREAIAAGEFPQPTEMTIDGAKQKIAQVKAKEERALKSITMSKEEVSGLKTHSLWSRVSKAVGLGPEQTQSNTDTKKNTRTLK